MAEKIDSGHYRVGVTDVTDHTSGSARNALSKTSGVIRGEVINDCDVSPWGRIFGVSDSKWYAYDAFGLAVKKRLPDGKLATTGSDSHTAIEMVQREFDTQDAAEEYLSETRSFDETF